MFDPKIFGSNLKKAIRKSTKSQKDLSELIGKSEDTITNYVKGKTIPKIDIVFELAYHLGVDVSFLIPIEVQDSNSYTAPYITKIIEKFSELDTYNQTKIEGMIELKLTEQHERQNIYMVAEDETKVIKEDAPKYVRTVGRVAAGHGVDEIDLMDMDDLIQVAGLKNVDYALKVVGDSMEPLIPDGSTVLVREQPEVENGDIAIVSIDGKVTCKKYYQENGSVWLESINKKYPDRDITEKDGETRVLGKVILDVNGYSR